MSTDEDQISVLIDAWFKALEFKARGSFHEGDSSAKLSADFWDGFISGIAAAISVASGLPSGGISMPEAVRFGCEMAQARRWPPNP